MKLLRKIKHRLLPRRLHREEIVRYRYWRGHGVHSPFMYSVVRNVFMRSRIAGPDTALYGKLRACGVPGRSAVLLQNLCAHCDPARYTLVGPGTDETVMRSRAGESAAGGKNGGGGEERRNLCILLPSVSTEIIVARAYMSAENRDTLVVLVPLRDTQRRALIGEVGERLHCVSVDRRDMWIFFFDPKLQKQHYRI